MLPCARKRMRIKRSSWGQSQVWMRATTSARMLTAQHDVVYVAQYGSPSSHARARCPIHNN